MQKSEPFLRKKQWNEQGSRLIIYKTLLLVTFMVSIVAVAVYEINIEYNTPASMKLPHRFRLTSELRHSTHKIFKKLIAKLQFVSSRNFVKIKGNYIIRSLYTYAIHSHRGDTLCRGSLEYSLGMVQLAVVMCWFTTQGLLFFSMCSRMEVSKMMVKKDRSRKEN
jgi:hypothetical protein